MESDDANDKQAFINKKELFWHKEKAHLEGNGHIMPPPKTHRKSEC